MHNGQIPQFAQVRRQWESTLSDELFAARRGSTDSEVMFLMLLSDGFSVNPQSAFERLVSRTLDSQHLTDKPSRMACVLSDGESLFAFRWSSDNKSPSLYVSKKLDAGGQAFASEPLDGDPENWTSIPEDHLQVLCTPN